MITGNGRNRKLGNIFPRLGNKLHKSSYKSTCNHNCSNSHCIKITCEITTFQLNFSFPLKMWLRFQLQFNFDTYFLAAFFRVAFPPRPPTTPSCNPSSGKRFSHKSVPWHILFKSVFYVFQISSHENCCWMRLKCNQKLRILRNPNSKVRPAGFSCALSYFFFYECIW